MPRRGNPTNRSTYNLQRRLGSLRRQREHFTLMVRNSEQRLEQVKGRLSSVETQMSQVEQQLR